MSAAPPDGVSKTTKTPCFSKRVPPGDERERLVCDDCGHIDYKNPKIVVSAVALHGDSVLLCRRGIEPRLGMWGIPQGFMELGETLKDGAAREAMEEAGADISPGPILAVYEVPGIVQICFLAELRNPEGLASGIETLETRLFRWDELPPSDELAFPTVDWALTYARKMLDRAAQDGAGGAGGLPTFVQPEQRVKVVPLAGGPPSGAAKAAGT